jgi:Family of unknown function (DUF5995)
MTVDEVIARMEAIVAPLRAGDGVCCFTRLYLDVTQAVQAQLARTSFADPEFLSQLDVVFAGLFFDALEAPKPPHAWAPLLEARGRRGIAPLQFALAGMNAHINRDLPVALVTCWREYGIKPDAHGDFERVNSLLEQVEAREKERYLGGPLRLVDRLVHRFDRIDDVLAMWNVRRARDAAWTNAQALWALRDDAPLADAYLATLDRTVGFAGRGLLQPADTWLQKLGRLIRR